MTLQDPIMTRVTTDASSACCELQTKHRMQAMVVAGLLLVFSVGQGTAGEIPNGFVWLRNLDPTLEQDIRYYGSHNITGGPLPGYDAPECLVTRETAEALVAVQRELAGSRLSLKVYDCFRPQRAVDAFVTWSEDPDDQAVKAGFYPRIDKSTVFDQGYFAKRSGHTRGSTLDLTIVPVGHTAERAYVPGEPLVDCTLPASERFPEASLDFGTGFECLDEKTHHGRTDVPAVAQANRLMLRSLMGRHGFIAYDGEWWHYTLASEPFPDTYFDFAITASPRPGGR
jgi:D-alanyl-D-alanine dipeptidase